MFEANRLPPPDEMGFFVHPDLPEKDDESVIPPLEAIGFECTCVCMEDDAPEDVVDAWFFQEDHTAPLRWTPTTPCGDGWLLAAKYDTEQGPYALFVRPTAAATGSLLR